MSKYVDGVDQVQWIIDNDPAATFGYFANGRSQTYSNYRQVKALQRNYKRLCDVDGVLSVEFSNPSVEARFEAFAKPHQFKVQADAERKQERKQAAVEESRWKHIMGEDKPSQADASKLAEAQMRLAPVMKVATQYMQSIKSGKSPLLPKMPIPDHCRRN